MSHKIFQLAFTFIIITGMVFTPTPKEVRAAGPWYVSTTGDDNNDCLSPVTACATINGAIGKASNGDTVFVSGGTYNSIGSEVVLIDRDIMLFGGWNTDFTGQTGMSVIDGQGTRRGLVAQSNVTATVDHFTIQNGFSADGGAGIFNPGGIFTLNNSIVSNNQADCGFSCDVGGGGIYNAGSLTTNESTINDNTADGGGGGIFNYGGVLTLNSSTVAGNRAGDTFWGGGIYGNGTININNSTISSNFVVNGAGGGIFAWQNGPTVVNLNNTTVTENSAYQGAGIGVDPTTVSPFLTVNLQNTIVAGNNGPFGPDCWTPPGVPDTIISSGYNIISITSGCDFTPSTGDLLNIEPAIGPIQDNGGPTFTHALLPGSLAINAGNPAGCTDQNGNLLTTDQRGVTRPQGFACDMGAFEFEEVVTPPANDNFADAEIITLPFITTVNTSYASIEPGEPQNCGFMNKTVWYSFTPTETMSIRVRMQPGYGFMNIYRATGTGISDLQHFQCLPPDNYATILAEVGQTYYLQTSIEGIDQGIIQFDVRQVFPSANDIFVNAESITSLPFSTQPDLTDAGIEPGEPQGCSFMYHTVWYAFTPSETMSIRATTQSNTGFMTIYRANGSGISNAQLLSCMSFGTPLNFLAEAGQTYYFQVGFAFGENPFIQVDLQQSFPPANDSFANAESIASLPFSAATDTTDTMLEPGEPQSCIFANNSVWYSFTPAETMSVRVDTQGSAVDAYVATYLATGDGITNLQFQQCARPGVSFTFLAEAGQTYYLQATSGIRGAIQVNVQQVIPPANDNLADVVVIPSLPFSETVDVSSATTEQNEPLVCGASDRTVWYTFVPAETMILVADTRSGSSPNINIYRGGPGMTDLQFVQCVNSGGAITFLAESGQTHYFQVSAPFGQAGTVQFSLSELTAITGRVTDTNTGQPLSGNAPPFAFVSLQRVCGDGCLELISSSPADNEGRFRFDSYFGGSLQAGTYQISVSASQYQTKQFGPFEFTGANLDVGDLPMDSVPLIGSISGRLLDNATNKPVTSTFYPYLQLFRCTDGNCFEYVNTLTPDSQGRFRFETDYNGNRLPVGTYQVIAYADQYQQAQTQLISVGEAENRTIGNLRIISYPVRFSDIQPCPAPASTGSECVFSVRITNGTAKAFHGATWSLVSSTLPDSYAGYTSFQPKEPQFMDLGSGKSRVLRFRFNIPARTGSYGTYICARVFVGQGSSPLFNTVGARDMFCVVWNPGPGGFTITAPQDISALESANSTAASTGVDSESNNSCQTAQDVGNVPLPFVLDGILDSSQTPDVDFFRLTGTPNAAVSVNLEGAPTGKGTVNDTFLGFFDSNCNFITYNDDSGTLNSRLEIRIPADGVYVLAATVCCDSSFSGGGNGTYQLTVSPIQVIGSISGRATDAVTGKALHGDTSPFAFVRLLRCEPVGCFDINSQDTGPDGRFRFETDVSGAPLTVGNYMVVVSADQYQTTQTEMFAVGEGEHHALGDIGVTSFPVRFSEIKPCTIPAGGGFCDFSVRITNGLATPFTGKAWSIVSGSGIGSFTGFTAFQTGVPITGKLGPGKSVVLHFRFRVPNSVADGATICATVFAAQGSDALNTVGQSFLFCFVKGSNGFTLMSTADAQAASQQLQIQKPAPPAELPELKK